MINILDRFEELHTALSSLPIQPIEQAIARLEEARTRQQTIFIIGNGGSAALASHLANDLNKLASANKQPRFRALSLQDNVPLMTAWANDAKYDVAVCEMLENFVQPGDILIALSTSGNSPNISRAIMVMGPCGGKVILLTGNPASNVIGLCDHVIFTRAPTQTEQEDLMSIVCHTIAEALREPEPFTIPGYFAEAAR